MKYLVRTLMILVFIPGAIILLLGFLLTIILFLLQSPVWFVWKGEFLEDDDTSTVSVWYIEHVIGWAVEIWEKILKWSRE